MALAAPCLPVKFWIVAQSVGPRQPFVNWDTLIGVIGR